MSWAQAAAALTAAVRENQRATDAFDAAVAARLGVNRTDGACLDVLDQLGGSATAGELAAALRLTSGSTTTMIDRLTGAGYVARVPDPGDRRRVVVTLTPTARERIGEIFGPIAAAGAEVFRPYSAAQLDLVRELLTAATSVLTAQIDRLGR
ncbi:MarR family transcriptional regulator [Asanoa sp. NPDC049573]|uniref:MarR family winged helix-turn-helix transcriptional regulator n=1 Tax=Asanoa sp. NPDC049573 TaxID=3155396 RepID=UPI00341FD6DE